MKEHLGGIDAFLDLKKASDFRSWEQSGMAPKANAKATKKGKPDDTNVYQRKKELKKQIRFQKSTVNLVERKVADLEQELTVLNDKLKEPDAYSNPENKELVANWPKVSARMEEEMLKWEKEVALLEELETKLAELEA